MMEWLQGQALLGTVSDICRALDMFAESCGVAGERRIISGFLQPWVFPLPVLSEVIGCRTVTSCSLFCMGPRVAWRSVTPVTKHCNWAKYAKYSGNNAERIANTLTYLKVAIT